MSRSLLLALLLSPLPWSAVQAAVPNDHDVAAFAERTVADACEPTAPGIAVLVARGDDVLYRGACGRASVELDVPLSPDHVFRIGSVTKQVAAAATLKLVEDGKLALDDTLDRFVPGYPGGDAITVRMLLDHTSGVRSYTAIPEHVRVRIMEDLDTAGLIATFRDEPADFPPGTDWRYNNSGYVLLGAVIEQASGMPWHAYLQQAFFAPLGMDHTGYGHPADGVIAGHVAGYTRNGERWVPARHLSMTQPHAAGALVSTVDDLLVWNRALHTGRLLQADSYRAMTLPAGKAAEHDYGFGITAQPLRGMPSLQHGGGIFGFASYLLYLPDTGITVAVLHNGDSPSPRMPGTGRLAHLLAAHAIGKPYPDKTPIDLDADILAGYEGVYRIDAEATRVLRVRDGRLTSQRTGGAVYPLIPVGADTFLFEEGFSRIVFERDAAGAVTAMRFFPEDEGEGEVVVRSEEPLPAAREAIELPRAALERLVGRYLYAGMQLDIALDGDTLSAQLAGQPAFALSAESPERFFVEVVDATLEFAPGPGPAATLTLHQNGQVLEFARED